jgi:hypothetical protein
MAWIDALSNVQKLYDKLCSRNAVCGFVDMMSNRCWKNDAYSVQQLSVTDRGFMESTVQVAIGFLRSNDFLLGR